MVNAKKGVTDDPTCKPVVWLSGGHQVNVR
jgi:hypothetical protein